ncbi:hypothetical protein OXYTRIMIC_576 [Oxytricha trifallax]|uniref:HMG box domain-containing protein n=1 Tax=Oxytricha trifallax TaxID=1172189 RepID=A0A073HZ91_9SPIT|nr:hypothetical protein OXYTRIMIC_576 [Oxytricha trifallax]
MKNNYCEDLNEDSGSGFHQEQKKSQKLKKPMNSYMVYLNEKRIERGGGFLSPDMMREIGQQWRDMSSDQKEKYEKTSQQIRQIYSETMSQQTDKTHKFIQYEEEESQLIKNNSIFFIIIHQLTIHNLTSQLYQQTIGINYDIILVSINFNYIYLIIYNYYIIQTYFICIYKLGFTSRGSQQISGFGKKRKSKCSRQPRGKKVLSAYNIFIQEVSINLTHVFNLKIQELLKLSGKQVQYSQNGSSSQTQEDCSPEKPKQSRATHLEKMKDLGLKWSNMSDKEKEPYALRSKEMKEQSQINVVKEEKVQKTNLNYYQIQEYCQNTNVYKAIYCIYQQFLYLKLKRILIMQQKKSDYEKLQEIKNINYFKQDKQQCYQKKFQQKPFQTSNHKNQNEQSISQTSHPEIQLPIIEKVFPKKMNLFEFLTKSTPKQQANDEQQNTE